jgi:type I restriction enzyme, R subunit
MNAKGSTLRRRMLDIPDLLTARLRDCQISAINNLETSFRANCPQALIQMATGSGKTSTAITSVCSASIRNRCHARD